MTKTETETERMRQRDREREGEREREKERERVCIGGRAVNLINETPMADFSRHDELQIRLEGRDSARVLYAALRDIHQPRHELRHSAVPASTDQRGGYKRFGEREREREREGESSPDTSPFSVSVLPVLSL